jgi:RNA polymerase-binding protein DksA
VRADPAFRVQAGAWERDMFQEGIMDRRERSEVREILMRRREGLRVRLAQVTRDVRHAVGLEADFEEQAIQRENDDVLATLDRAIRGELRQIEATLGRLDSGGYGVCDVCRKPISEKRLEALPHVTRCIECEKK